MTDIREAIAKVREIRARSHMDVKVHEMFEAVCVAAEITAPERRKQVPWERRTRRCSQMNCHRRSDGKRRCTDVNWSTLPLNVRTGPADRRKVLDRSKDQGRRLTFGQRGVIIVNGRRRDDADWQKNPQATPTPVAVTWGDTATEAEARARRAVAAIQGAEFSSISADNGFIVMKNYEFGMSHEICNAINALLDRAEAAELCISNGRNALFETCKLKDSEIVRLLAENASQRKVMLKQSECADELRSQLGMTRTLLYEQEQTSDRLREQNITLATALNRQAAKITELREIIAKMEPIYLQ